MTGVPMTPVVWATVFRLFGFPVHVRPGFLVFMALIVLLYGNEFGLWLAGSLTVLTLLHELGHATAARRAGADAEIALDFLAGYAAYQPTRPLTRWEQVGISFAGPGVQIAVAVVALLALGANPLDSTSWQDSSATAAIWWAGVAIGLLNLVPVLPLDGGHIVLTGLDKLMPGRADRPMLYASIAATGVLAVLTFTTDRFRGFGILVAFLLITQLQLLGATKKPESPWIAALDQLAAGRTRRAQRLLVAALSHPSDRPSPPARPLTRQEATTVVELLPRPLPRGNPRNELILGNHLLQAGHIDEAAHYAADSFERLPTSISAAIVARAAAASGDRATAVGWLRAAADSPPGGPALATIMDQSPELVGLRDDPEVAAIRRSLTPSPAA